MTATARAVPGTPPAPPHPGPRPVPAPARGRRPDRDPARRRDGRPGPGGSVRLPRPRPRPPRAPFLAVVVAVLGVGLLGLLALNTVLAQDAFRLHELRLEGRTLAVQEQALSTSVEQLSAPAALAERAQEQGMVPGGDPGFLRLSDGAVLGSPAPATAPPSPAPGRAEDDGSADDRPDDGASPAAAAPASPPAVELPAGQGPRTRPSAPSVRATPSAGARTGARPTPTPAPGATRTSAGTTPRTSGAAAGTGR